MVFVQCGVTLWRGEIIVDAKLQKIDRISAACYWEEDNKKTQLIKAFCH